VMSVEEADLNSLVEGESSDVRGDLVLSGDSDMTDAMIEQIHAYATPKEKEIATSSLLTRSQSLGAILVVGAAASIPN